MTEVVGREDIDAFANPEGLINYLSVYPDCVRLRPDHKLVLKRAWSGGAERLKGVTSLVRTLSEIAASDS